MLSQDTITLIQNFSKNNSDFDDNVKAFLTFGHLFENNVAVTLANTYVVSGKPALNADAMAGVVRRYKDHNGIKICAYIRIIEISETSCTVGTKRRDEMEFDLEHTWTYTIEDAAKRNSLKQKQWKEMPKNMLHKRCLTALLRAVYPEIIGQSYSPDELAECMIQDEKLRDEIVFASATGERVPKGSTPPKQDDTTPF